MIRRIYISGPITGTTDYKQRFEETEKKLKETFPDADIVNPVKITIMLGNGAEFFAPLNFNRPFMNLISA